MKIAKKVGYAPRTFCSLGKLDRPARYAMRTLHLNAVKANLYSIFRQPQAKQPQIHLRLKDKAEKTIAIRQCKIETKMRRIGRFSLFI